MTRGEQQRQVACVFSGFRRRSVKACDGRLGLEDTSTAQVITPACTLFLRFCVSLLICFLAQACVFLVVLW